MLDSKRVALMEALSTQYKMAADVAKSYKSNSINDTHKTRTAAHKMAGEIAAKDGDVKAAAWHSKEHARYQKRTPVKPPAAPPDDKWAQDWKAKDKEKGDAEFKKNSEIMAAKSAAAEKERARKKTPEEIAAIRAKRSDKTKRSMLALKAKLAKMDD
jgi:hypothetical protein